MGRSSVTSPPGVTDASPLSEPVLLCRCSSDRQRYGNLGKVERPVDGDRRGMATISAEDAKGRGQNQMGSDEADVASSTAR